MSVVAAVRGRHGDCPCKCCKYSEQVLRIIKKSIKLIS
jgi:hypothetical protein